MILVPVKEAYSSAGMRDVNGEEKWKRTRRRKNFVSVARGAAIQTKSASELQGRGRALTRRCWPRSRAPDPNLPRPVSTRPAPAWSRRTAPKPFPSCGGCA